MKLRFLDYLLTIVALVILAQLLLSTTHAQTVKIGRYACAVATNSRADADEFDLKKILVKTYDPNLDSAILNDMGYLNDIFQVEVGVYYPNDNKEDAFFSSSADVNSLTKRDLHIRDDIDPDRNMTGYIFISRRFLEREFQENFGGTMSVPAILAHEYAHAFQYSKGSTLGKGIRKELQADFLAGWYIAYRCKCIGPQDVNAAFNSFYRKGDHKDFFDSDHHGSGQQRYEAALAGYNYFNQVSQRYRSGVAAANDAYEYSLKVVREW